MPAATSRGGQTVGASVVTVVAGGVVVVKGRVVLVEVVDTAGAAHAIATIVSISRTARRAFTS
jgi:hypothetical protein